MSSVHGFAELLMSREFDAQTTRTIAGTIHRQSSLLVSMVNELLDLARIESGRGRDFDIRLHPLGPIVRETVDGLLISGDSRKVEIDPSIDADLTVAVDASQLRLALTNVLSNAYKYSRGAGRIWVDAVVAERNQRRHAGLRIGDAGIGMTPEQLSRIFERFYRADPGGSIPGTGLGMSLVKDIVELMGGAVEVSSEAGKGTCVTLWLPLLPAAEER
jgi:signal transduction histidine kinase